MNAIDARVEPLLSNLSKVLSHRRARRVPLAGRSPMANTTAGEDGQPGTVCISGLADDQ